MKLDVFSKHGWSGGPGYIFKVDELAVVSEHDELY